MNLDTLFALLAEAKKLCGHKDYVVIGSLSVLGMSEVAAIPADMTLSIDADCYTQADPGRALDLQAALGEGSPWHVTHGIYLDPVNPHLPTLPDQWQGRLIALARGDVVAHFLEPHDAAVSKLARGEPRDLRWVLAGARANILALPTVALRMQTTSFLDDAEQSAARMLLDKLRQTLQKVI
jgi:hypothetical protein